MQSAADIGALGAANARGGESVSNASPAAFGLTCVCVLVAAAALAGLAPLWLSVATVFAFAGPHNWAELRFFITRLPARLGRSRGFFALAGAGVFGLTVAYAALALGADSGVWGEGGWYAATALWNSAAVAWVVGLVALRGRQRSRGGGWVWALPAGCALAGLGWLAPQGFALALVYVHPLVALWFLDRQIRLTRRGWGRAYRACLALLPVALVLLWWGLAGAAPLAEDGEVASRVVRHAGAGIVPAVSTHVLVSTHVFLETLHYGVWLVGVPLAAGVGLAPWRAAGVPLARDGRGRPRLIRALLVAGGFIVLLLWLCFAADYATTRDIYFTVAMAHVLAEVPFLLRTL
ncbi:MAG TPA: hypothetical protein VN282_22865 [Pyrinomonadaceae bacterium]|nr:hypothetical protein [Pyrinomonadaceae bacterium]